MSKFEKACKLRKCIKCKVKGRLIPLRPGNYKQMNCMNCGAHLTLKEEPF